MNYIRMQIKRVGRSLPAILLPAVALVGIAALLSWMIWSMNEDSADKKKVEIALVGDLSDPYLKLGMYVLEDMDPVHDTVAFLPMSEEEAIQKLDRGQITAYAVIPEGLVESIMRGENKKVTYVAAGGSAEMVSVLVRELLEALSAFLVETQNSVYGMQRILEKYGMEGQIQAATVEFDLRYMDLFLNRAQIYEVKEIGLSNKLSLQGYYVCSMLLLFLLLWGIACSPLFVKRDLAFQKLLRAGGQKLWMQVTGEYVAYVLLMAVCVLATAAILAAGMRAVQTPVPEWEAAGQGELFLLAVRALPVMAMISAVQLFLFELVTGIASGVLLQFLSAVCMGYLSGCFYPISFLPSGIQKISSFLPSGIGLRYLDACMPGQGGADREIPGIVISVLLFLGLTMLVRKRKLAES